MAAEVASRLSLEVVDVIFRRQGKYTLLRIDIDRAGAPGVGLEDCERVSRELEERLDRTELFTDRYDLQVSSPGLERPIRTSDDIRRNAGRRIVVETSQTIDGTTRLRGVLLGSRAGTLVLRVDGAAEEVVVPLTAVTSAHQDADADLRTAGGGGKRARRHGRSDRHGIV